MATTEDLMLDLANMGGSDHSATQMDSFILEANGVSTYGKYRQALRQLHQLIRSVRNLRYEIERVDIDVDECVYNIQEGFRDKFDERRCIIDLAESRFKAADLQEKFASKSRELQHFHDAAIKLKDELSVDVSDPAAQLEAELDHWTELYCRDVTLQLQSTGTVHVGLLRDIHALPDKQRDLILTMMMQNRIMLGNGAPRELITEQRRTLGDGARSRG